MVSQRRDRRRGDSRDRLLAAATSEFARRGFDGARVDAIARQARVTKAMVYYHFVDKAALYRAILTDVFDHVAVAAAAAAVSAGDPPTRLSAFIRAVARQAAGRPDFPVMWLRELADGGRHFDRSVIARLAQVISALQSILDAGVRTGQFRPAHPLITQMGIVAPLMVFSASAVARARLRRALPAAMAGVAPAEFLAHIEASTLAGLARDRSGRRPRRRER